MRRPSKTLAGPTIGGESLWSRLAGLPLGVEGCEYERLHSVLAYEFERITTQVRLAGAGADGLGQGCLGVPRRRDRVARDPAIAAARGRVDAGGLLPSFRRARVVAGASGMGRGTALGNWAFAPGASSAAPLGYSPSEDGPSGPVSRRGVDDFRFGGVRTNIKKILGNDPRGREQPPHQRTEPRLGRVFPRAAWRTCQRSISGRSQRLGRPRPRSRTGRGMSG
jgi:hypothetical protein